jgi:hypothetical protein
MTTLALYLTLALGDTDHDETQRTKTKRKRAYLITPEPEYFMFKTTILNKTTSVVVNVQNAGSYVADKVQDSSVYKESRRIRKEFLERLCWLKQCKGPRALILHFSLRRKRRAYCSADICRRVCIEV